MKTLNLILVLSVVAALGCGKNQFESMEKKDPAQDAANELENDNPDKAIAILEAALGDDGDDPVLVSLLSAAYAQKNKVDILELALKMATADEEEEAPSSDIALLWPYLPTASEAHMEGLDYAVTLLIFISPDDRTKADNFKLAILSLAAVSLRAKSFDLDGDGELSVQELLSMNGDDAEAILNGILGASSAILAGYADGENADKAAEMIGSIADDLDSAEGDTDEEKLRNYFETQQSQ